MKKIRDDLESHLESREKNQSMSELRDKTVSDIFQIKTYRALVTERLTTSYSQLPVVVCGGVEAGQGLRLMRYCRTSD